MGNFKAINRNWTIVQEFMKQVESELPGKIPDCKKVKISQSSSFKNVIDFEMFFNSKYERAELEKFLNKAVPIINSMANQYNSRFEPSKPKYKIEFLKPYQLLFPRSKSVGFAYVYYVE